MTRKLNSKIYIDNLLNEFLIVLLNLFPFTNLRI